MEKRKKIAQLNWEKMKIIYRTIETVDWPNDPFISSNELQFINLR